MYKVMIVDDEKEIRMGLKLKIEWEKLGFQIAGEASNGIEALELLRKEQFHLLITDIRMPFMDGLTLLQHCADEFPNLKTIILSGHDDFAYLKSAIQFRTRDYLLKPTIRKEMTELLIRISEELKEEQEQLLQYGALQWAYQSNIVFMQEELIMNAINGLLSDHPSTEINRCHLEHILDEQSPVHLFCVEMRIPEGRLGDREDQRDLLNKAFQLFCRDFSHKSELPSIAFHDKWHHCMMHFIVKSGTAAPNHLLKEMIEQLQQHIKQYLKVESIVGVGQAVVGISELRKGYISSLLSWGKSSTDIRSQVIWPEDQTSDTPLELSIEFERGLTLAIENADLNRFSRILKNELLKGKTYTVNTLFQLYLRVNVLIDSIMIKNAINVIDANQQIIPQISIFKESLKQEELVNQLIQNAQSAIEQLERAKPTSVIHIVDSVKQYIDRNFAEDISLNQLADMHFIHNTYLSESFKKHTGSTFSEYLTGVRMQKAAEFLVNTDMKLADIAEMCGFSNANYFSTAFKKRYGKSPNDYRTDYLH